MSEDGQYGRKFYGRTKGKALRKKQQERMETLLPKLVIDGVGDGTLDLQVLFGNDNPVWVEIGFGGGEHLAHIAGLYPEVNFIGCEAYINGVASILRHIEEGALGNVKLHPGDARDLLESLPSDSVERVFLLYPDPWPKERHAKRRFVTATNICEVARVLKAGAELRIASDIPEYIDYAQSEIATIDGFSPIEHDIYTPWVQFISTRYEKKAIRENRVPHYLRYVKKTA